MNKNLATIQTVTNVRTHPNADALDLVQVLGWQVVVKRGEYKEGDLCVYVVIDTVLPDKPEFEFLRNKNFRIKPIRLRGTESAGICFPLTILKGLVPEKPVSDLVPETIFPLVNIGDDVTDLIGVTKYEKPIPPELAGQMIGSLPGFLIVTDEDNLRTYNLAVPELYGRPYYITRKEDGSSGTFFVKGGEFGVTSRRIHLKPSDTNGFWKIARKYNLENALKTEFPNMDIAIQGEVIGPGIQKNRVGVKELELRVFNLFDIVGRSYLDFQKIVDFTTKYNIPMVPIVESGVAFGYTLEELVKLANLQMYDNKPAEGIVIRPKEGFYSTVLKKTWSGKVLNENYNE